jgi:hypothetical protein
MLCADGILRTKKVIQKPCQFCGSLCEQNTPSQTATCFGCTKARKNKAAKAFQKANKKPAPKKKVYKIEKEKRCMQCDVLLPKQRIIFCSTLCMRKNYNTYI